VKESEFQENTFFRRRQFSACWFRIVGLAGEGSDVSRTHPSERDKLARVGLGLNGQNILK